MAYLMNASWYPGISLERQPYTRERSASPGVLEAVVMRRVEGDVSMRKVVVTMVAEKRVRRRVFAWRR